MDDHVPEVEQHPAALLLPLLPPQIMTFRFQSFFQVVGKGVKVERRLRGGDHEVVREARRAGDVYQGNVQRLPVRQNVDRLVRQGFRFQ